MPHLNGFMASRLNSVALIRRVRTSAGLFMAALAPAPAWGGDAAQPVVLPPVNVIESVLKIKVVIKYRQRSYFGPYVEKMLVGSVKTPSVAQQAGLMKGMEIVAIQGVDVEGLSQADVEQLMTQEVEDSVVLLVRRPGRERPEEIRIPVPAADPRASPPSKGAGPQ